jgi:hypothetical protein
MVSAQEDREIVDFLGSFSLLKEICDDDPAELAKLCLTDDSAVQIASKCFSAYHAIKERELLNPSGFVHSVSNNYIKSYREYQNRYHLLSMLCAMLSSEPKVRTHIENVLEQISIDQGVYTRLSDFSKPERNDDTSWESANEAAEDLSKAINSAIVFSESLACYLEDDKIIREEVVAREDEGLLDEIDLANEGCETLQGLDDIYGVDLKGIFRRKRLSPLVLIPTKASYGSLSPFHLTMYSALQQAQQAFLFGIYFASISMLRSTVEVILRDYYKVGGINREGRPKDLRQMIDDARVKLPKGISTMHLHRLRIRANEILHVSPREDKLGKNSVMALEIEVLDHLHIVRRLIEELR